jgi:hypothetical protein
MLSKLRPHSAYDVMAALALFLVVTGGTAFAVVSANQVNSASIIDHEVKKPDLASNSVVTVKVQDGSLLRQDFKPGELGQRPEFATVSSSGPVQSGTALGGFRDDVGHYNVYFNRDVSNCTVVVTPGGTNGSGSGVSTGRTYSAVAGGKWDSGALVSDHTSVAVDFLTAVAEGTHVDRADTAFHIAVFC